MVSEGLLKTLFNETCDESKKYGRKVVDKLEQLEHNGIDRREASHHVSWYLWHILTKWAEVFAIAMAKDSRADDWKGYCPCPSWEPPLKMLLDVVRSLASHYPSWTAVAKAPIREAWEALGAEVFGCRFDPGESEDRIVLNGQPAT